MLSAEEVYARILGSAVLRIFTIFVESKYCPCLTEAYLDIQEPLNDSINYSVLIWMLGVTVEKELSFSIEIG